MKTVKNCVINEIIINKSRFITILDNINDINDVKEKINYYKNQYKNASHYCFAFIVDSQMKCDDDGEPSGTAGLPILNVLKQNSLTNTLCIVIRYFGGIKLGSGGLIRAYSGSASEALKKNVIVNLTKGYYVEIEFSYDDIKVINNILENIVIKKDFNEKIKYSFKINYIEYEKVEKILKQYSKILKKESILLRV